MFKTKIKKVFFRDRNIDVDSCYYKINKTNIISKEFVDTMGASPIKYPKHFLLLELELISGTAKQLNIQREITFELPLDSSFNFDEKLLNNILYENDFTFDFSKEKELEIVAKIVNEKIKSLNNKINNIELTKNEIINKYKDYIKTS